LPGREGLGIDEATDSGELTMQQASTQKIDTEIVRSKAYELWIKGGRRQGVAEAERILSATNTARATDAATTSAPSTPAAAPISVKPAPKSTASPSNRKR
jgi:hypothetical protein